MEELECDGGVEEAQPLLCWAWRRGALGALSLPACIGLEHLSSKMDGAQMCTIGKLASFIGFIRCPW